MSTNTSPWLPCCMRASGRKGGKNDLAGIPSPLRISTGAKLEHVFAQLSGRTALGACLKGGLIHCPPPPLRIHTRYLGGPDRLPCTYVSCLHQLFLGALIHCCAPLLCVRTSYFGGPQREPRFPCHVFGPLHLSQLHGEQGRRAHGGVACAQGCTELGGRAILKISCHGMTSQGVVGHQRRVI